MQTKLPPQGAHHQKPGFLQSCKLLLPMGAHYHKAGCLQLWLKVQTASDFEGILSQSSSPQKKTLATNSATSTKGLKVLEQTASLSQPETSGSKNCLAGWLACVLREIMASPRAFLWDTPVQHVHASSYTDHHLRHRPALPLKPCWADPSDGQVAQAVSSSGCCCLLLAGAVAAAQQFLAAAGSSKR